MSPLLNRTLRVLKLQACLAGVLCVLSASGSSAVDWTSHARRFTGESDRVRQDAIQALRKDPKLTEKLKKGLGTNDHFLALDVISVLKLRSFIPILSRFSEKDRTGYSYHVLNSLMLAEEVPELSRLYQTRLQSPKSSPAAKLAILDSLGRMQVRLGTDDLRPLLSHEDPEVRSAVLYYLRTAILRWGRFDGFELTEPALKDPAYQIRIQALYLLSELPKALPSEVLASVNRSLKSCGSDPVGEVQSLCRHLNSRYSPGSAR